MDPALIPRLARYVASRQKAVPYADLVQEGHLAALESPTRARVLGAMVDAVRREYRARGRGVALQEPSYTPAPTDDPPRPHVVSPLEWDVFLARNLRGEPVPETAARLGLSPSRVYGIERAALLKLRLRRW